MWRFDGTETLDPERVGRDASKIADEVLAHLVCQAGAEVTVTLEIEAILWRLRPDRAHSNREQQDAEVLKPWIRE